MPNSPGKSCKTGIDAGDRGSAERQGGKTAGPRSQKVKLSPTDIDQIARQMQMPESVLQMVLERYPELVKPLARRWLLTARKRAA